MDTSLSTDVALLPFDSSILAGTISASSRRMYGHDILAYLAFAGTREQALDPTTLARWRTELANRTDPTYSPNTINRMLFAVRSLMFAAAEQHHLSRENTEAFSQVRGVKVALMKEQRKAHARTLIHPEEYAAPYQCTRYINAARAERSYAVTCAGKFGRSCLRSCLADCGAHQAGWPKLLYGGVRKERY